MATHTSKDDGPIILAATLLMPTSLHHAQKDICLGNMQKELIQFGKRNECLKKNIGESIRRVVHVQCVMIICEVMEKETQKVHAAHP